MAKGAPATSDESADEVAHQFSSPPRSKSKSKAEHKISSSTKKTANRKSRQADSEEEADSGEEAAASAAQEEEVEGEDSEVEEYEIEKILDVKVGAIEESPDEICYFVHWKGYDSDEDSWTTETNAEGARELIRVFWKSRKRASKPSRDDLLEAHEAKKARKKAGRKSNATPSIKKTRVSSVNDGSSEDLGEVALKRPVTSKNGKTRKSSTPIPSVQAKRRRSSVPRADEMDVDEIIEEPLSKGQPDDEAPPPKKHKSAPAGRNARGKAKDTSVGSGREPGNGSGEIDLADTMIKNTLLKYGKMKSWDDIVEDISTVEQRASDHKLQIFFRSTDGQECLALSEIFREKSPLKLINFYESNLKWRPSDA